MQPDSNTIMHGIAGLLLVLGVGWFLGDMVRDLLWRKKLKKMEQQRRRDIRAFVGSARWIGAGQIGALEERHEKAANNLRATIFETEDDLSRILERLREAEMLLRGDIGTEDLQIRDCLSPPTLARNTDTHSELDSASVAGDDEDRCEPDMITKG